MAKTLLLSVVLLAIAFAALGVKALFVKNGRFPSGHAHDIESRRRAAKARLRDINENKSKN